MRIHDNLSLKFPKPLKMRACFVHKRIFPDFQHSVILILVFRRAQCFDTFLSHMHCVGYHMYKPCILTELKAQVKLRFRRSVFPKLNTHWLVCGFAFPSVWHLILLISLLSNI